MLGAGSHALQEQVRHRRRGVLEAVAALAEDPRRRHLIHRAGGTGGATWFIDYDKRTRADDEAGYRLSTHRFAPGEYVSIADDDEKLHTFLVMQVKDV